jgi:hypothetical protein
MKEPIIKKYMTRGKFLVNCNPDSDQFGHVMMQTYIYNTTSQFYIIHHSIGDFINSLMDWMRFTPDAYAGFPKTAAKRDKNKIANVIKSSEEFINRNNWTMGYNLRNYGSAIVTYREIIQSYLDHPQNNHAGIHLLDQLVELDTYELAEAAVFTFWCFYKCGLPLP